MLQKKEHSVYSKMLISFTTLIIAILMVMIFLCYSLFNQRYTAEVEKAQRSMIQHENDMFKNVVLDRASEMYKTLTSDFSTQTLYSTPLTKAESSCNVAIYQIYRKLVAFVGLNSDMVDQIIVFYPGQNICISSKVGYKVMSQRANQAYLLLYQSLVIRSGSKLHYQYVPNTYTAYSMPDEDSGEDRNNLVFTGTPLWNLKGGEPVCVTFFIKNSFLKDVMRSVFMQGQNVYLIDRNEELCFYTNDPDCPSDFLEDAVVRQLLASDQSSPQTEISDDGRVIYAHCAMADSGLSVIVSMSVDAWQGSANSIRWVVTGIGAAAMVIACSMVMLISRKLYSPLRVISDLVHELPSISTRNLKNEYSIIHTGLDELVHLLSNSQRILHTNRSLIKNQVLWSLLTDGNPSGYADTLSYLNLNFAHACYSLYAVTFCEADVRRLPQDTQEILSVGLVEMVEKQYEEKEVTVAGVVVRQNTVCFIVNHEAHDDRLSEMTDMIHAYFDCYNVRVYLVHNMDTVTSLQQLNQLYPQIDYLLSGRLYDLREEKIHTARVTKATDAAPALLEALTDAQDDAALIYAVRGLVDAMSQMPPTQAQVCLQKCMAVLRSCMVNRRLELPPFLLEPYSCLWKISELPQALQQALGSADKSVETDEAEFINSVRAYVDQHIMEEISLETMGAVMCFNAKYFSRKFKKASGVTFSSYVANRWLELAACQLRTTRLSIKQIASNLGFDTVQYFGRRFKAAYGITPGEYRRASCEGEESAETPLE